MPQDMTMQSPDSCVVRQKPDNHVSPGWDIDCIFANGILEIKGASTCRSGWCERVVVIPASFPFVGGGDVEVEAVLVRELCQLTILTYRVKVRLTRWKGCPLASMLLIVNSTLTGSEPVQGTS